MWRIIVGCFLIAACAGESSYENTVDGSARVRRQQQHLQQAAPVQHINYRPYNEAPARIKGLLQLQQAREPLVHLPAQPPPQLRAEPLGHQGIAAAGPGPAPQHVPFARPAQYNPKVQYNQAPQQPTYKGIQAQPLSSQAAQQAPQNALYRPQYKSQFGPAQHQPSPNALYRPLAQAPVPQADLRPHQPQGPTAQFPKNLPLDIQKIIESQRAYQG